VNVLKTGSWIDMRNGPEAETYFLS